jgi:hypothetical protein
VKFLRVVIVALATLVAGNANAQQKESSFFKGKEITFLSALTLGGQSGIYMTQVAESLPPYLGEGASVRKNPTIQLGGPGSTATELLMRSDPDTTLHILHPAALLEANLYQFHDGKTDYPLDLLKAPYIGAIASNQVVVCRSDRIPPGLAQLAGIPASLSSEQEVFMSSATLYGTKHLKTEALFSLAGDRYKMLSLGNAIGEQLRALEGNELYCLFVESGFWSLYVRDGKVGSVPVKTLFQDGLMAGGKMTKEEGIDAPILGDLVASACKRKDHPSCHIFSIINEAALTAIVMHPQASPEAVRILREAFERLHKDPAFREKLVQTNFGLGFVPGAEAEQRIKGISRDLRDPKIRKYFEELLPAAFAPRK